MSGKALLVFDFEFVELATVVLPLLHCSSTTPSRYEVYTRTCSHFKVFGHALQVDCFKPDTKTSKTLGSFILSH